MINNEVRLIGTIVSEFEDGGGSENFQKWKVLLEVEKKQAGKTCQIWVTVYGSNRQIDTSVSLNGKRVIAIGYVDSYKDFIKIVAQEFLVISSADKVDEMGDMIPQVKSGNLDNVELPDDDLPF